MTIVAAETIPELATLLERQLAPTAQRESEAAHDSMLRVAQLQESVASSTEHMESLHLPQTALARLQSAVESAAAARAAASAYATQCQEALDALRAAREGLRAQEAVADAAAAAGGAADRAAYAG